MEIPELPNSSNKVKLKTNVAVCLMFPVDKGKRLRFTSIQKSIHYCNENDSEVVNKLELYKFYWQQLKK